MGLRLLGPRLQELGLAEPHLHGARRIRRPLRVPRRRPRCNPYLTIASLLYAGLDGIRNEIDPGEPQSRNTYDILAEQAENGSKPSEKLERVPDSLGAALEALDKDELIKSAMPGRLYDVFKWYKRDEWERYLAAVTDWERDEYLEVLP